MFQAILNVLNAVASATRLELAGYSNIHTHKPDSLHRFQSSTNSTFEREYKALAIAM